MLFNLAYGSVARGGLDTGTRLMSTRMSPLPKLLTITPLSSRVSVTCGFGAEIAATIAQEAFENLDAPVRRVAAPDTPVPFAPVLEKAFIPQVDDVVKAAKGLVRG